MSDHVSVKKLTYSDNMKQSQENIQEFLSYKNKINL